MEKLLKSNSTPKCTAAIVILLLLGSLSAAITTPFKQVAYAHTFTGDESASFRSVIRILQAEANLVQTNLSYKSQFGTRTWEICRGNSKRKSHVWYPAK